MCYLLLLCCFGEFGLGVDLGVVSLLVFFVMMMMMMMVVVVMEYYLHKLYLLLKWLCCALLISNCFFGLIGREREREKMGYLFLAYYRGDFLTLSTLSFYIRLWT